MRPVRFRALSRDVNWPLVALALLGSSACSLILDFPQPAAREAVEPSADAGEPDATVDGGIDQPPSLPFLPASLAGELNVAAIFDRSPALTRDGLEIYFVSNRPGGPGLHDIYASQRSSPTAPWQTPTLVAALSSAQQELTLDLSPDGLAIYFASDRAGGAGGWDIWWSTRASRAAPWQVPQPLAAINTAGHELHPGISADQTEIFFSVQDPALDFEIARARRATATDPWGPPEAVPELGSSAGEACASLGAGGRYIAFCSNRPGAGGWDFYWAWRPARDQPFAAPVPMNELNSAGDEVDPRISEDLSVLWFAAGTGMDQDLRSALRMP